MWKSRKPPAVLGGIIPKSLESNVGPGDVILIYFFFLDKVEVEHSGIMH